MNFDAAPFAQDPAAAPALGWMGEGRWRKARDAAKELCKRDRGRYLPLLLASNVGLVREMLGKGLPKEATTVIDYLESFAPAALISTLRAEMSSPVVKRTPTDSVKGDRAAWWAVALRADAAKQEISPADLAVIDLLVADAYTPPVTVGDEAVQRLAAELAAVRAACDATGDGRWDEAREQLRGLPRQSVFRHWRLFLRGVRCVFEDQCETARQCFADLPPDGALARAARAFDADLVAAGPSAPASARIPLYLAATGQPAAWGIPILASSAAWKAGKRVKAFEELQTGMKGSFPANQPGLAAVLTEAVLPYRVRMDDEDFDHADELADHYGLDGGRKSRHSPDSMLSVLRPMCIVDADDLSPGELDRSWRTVIDLWNRSEGADPLRDSVAWQWLGEALAKAAPESFGRTSYFQASAEPDLGKARKALEKSVDCDPGNDAAWLALLSLLARQGDEKSHNRLLGELVKRFPRNKTILVKAGMHALDRRTYDKCLAALRAALALDPLDKQVKLTVLVALVQQTREYLRKERPVASLWAEMEPLLEDRPGREYLMLARWISRLRQALLDPASDSTGQAMADAGRMAPSLIERLFMEDSLVSVYRLELRQDWQREWMEALAGTSWGWRSFSNAMDLMAFTSQIKGWGWRENNRAGIGLLAMLKELLGKNLSKDLDGLLDFLDHIESPQKGLTEHAKHLFGLCTRDLSDGLEQAVRSGKKKLDPRLSLAHLMLQIRSGNHLYASNDRVMKSLQAVATTATDLGMPAVVARVAKLCERLAQAEGNRASNQLDDHWDEGDDDFESAFFDDADEIEERAVRAVRDALIGLGMTEEKVDEAMEKALRGTNAPPPPKPTTGKPNKAPRPPLVDPAQPDLF